MLYAGRLSKVYIDAPRTMLRYRMWVALRRHPNVTFWATDVDKCVAPYLALPNERCRTCSYGCPQCLEGLSPGADLSVGTAPRMTPRQYRELMGNSTFCLILRGDTPSTRKFSEAVLAGCVPVLIADMPAWPFDQRLDYTSFTIEFDWRAAMRSPRAVIEMLLRVTPAQLAAKQAALARVRPHFRYHADPQADGATHQLIQDMCASRRTVPKRAKRLKETKKKPTSQPSIDELYQARPMLGRELLMSGDDVAAPSVDVVEEPVLPRSWVPRGENLTWADGYCQKTDEDEHGGCNHGSKGSWSLPSVVVGAGWPAVARACEQRCARCARCRYMSASIQYADCGWFMDCPPADKLKHRPSGFSTAALSSRVHADAWPVARRLRAKQGGGTAKLSGGGAKQNGANVKQNGRSVKGGSAKRNGGGVNQNSRSVKGGSAIARTRGNPAAWQSLRNE